MSNIPDKWHLCDGTNGTPNLTGRFLEGVTSSPGSTKSAGLPNLTGHTKESICISPGSKHGSSDQSGAIELQQMKVSNVVEMGSFGGTCKIVFDASKSNSIYGSSTTVQPASYTVLYIMKIKA